MRDTTDASLPVRKRLADYEWLGRLLAYVLPVAGLIFAVRVWPFPAPNGVILNAGGGCYSVSEIPETRGAFLGKAPTPEDVQAHWDEITAGGYVDVLENGPAQFTKFLGMARGETPVSAR